VLAEGSKVVLVAVESSRVAGEYALVSNLGSLLVRTLLQPLEDVAFTAFSRWVVVVVVAAAVVVVVVGA
jgi:oligosaccharide translocation protein RFT1